MTKATGGKTIIVKINGQKRSFHEEPVKKELKIIDDSNQETVTLPAPPATKNALEEAAAAKELSEGSFEWILPENAPLQIESSDMRQTLPSATDKKFWKKKLGGFKSIILPVIFAVIIGTILGIVMLKLVIKDYGKPASIMAPAQQNTGENRSESGEKSAPVLLKSWTTYVVQGGMYSSKDAVAMAAKQAVKSGIPAQDFEINGQHFLFLGVADSRENARKLVNSYQSMDGIFSKSITIPEKKLIKITESEHHFLKDAAALFPILTKAASNSEFAAANSQEILSSISSLESNIQKMDNSQLKNKTLIELKTEITAASDQVKLYLKKKNQESLIKAQQHLLAFLSIYYGY